MSRCLLNMQNNSSVSMEGTFLVGLADFDIMGHYSRSGNLGQEAEFPQEKRFFFFSAFRKFNLMYSLLSINGSNHFGGGVADFDIIVILAKRPSSRKREKIFLLPLFTFSHFDIISFHILTL